MRLFIACVYGSEVCLLAGAIVRRLGGFRSRCLALLLDRDPTTVLHDDLGVSIMKLLMHRRRNELGHALRMDESRSVKKVFLSRAILCPFAPDALSHLISHPPLSSMQTLAQDRPEWSIPRKEHNMFVSEDYSNNSNNSNNIFRRNSRHRPSCERDQTGLLVLRNCWQQRAYPRSTRCVQLSPVWAIKWRLSGHVCVCCAEYAYVAYLTMYATITYEHDGISFYKIAMSIGEYLQTINTVPD